MHRDRHLPQTAIITVTGEMNIVPEPVFIVVIGVVDFQFDGRWPTPLALFDIADDTLLAFRFGYHFIAISALGVSLKLRHQLFLSLGMNPYI